VSLDSAAATIAVGIVETVVPVRTPQIVFPGAALHRRSIAEFGHMFLSFLALMMTKKAKPPTLVATPVVRELPAFIWTINRQITAWRVSGGQGL
jgi:hypothetical protein